MRKLYAVVLVAAAFGVGICNAQTAPTVKAIQPGLVEVAGPRVVEAVAAGIQKLTATPGKGGQSIAVKSPWGDIFFDWPKGVKPMAFTIETTGTAAAMTATISAPGFTEANRADYKAAIEAVVPMAIKQAQAQKDRKTKQG